MTAGDYTQSHFHCTLGSNNLKSLSGTLSTLWLMDYDKMSFQVHTALAGIFAFFLSAAPKLRSFMGLWGLRWYL